MYIRPESSVIRQPARRWEDITRVVRDGRHNGDRDLDDPNIREAMAFCRELHRLQDAADRSQVLRKRFGSLYDAYEIATGGRDLRLAIEAFVVSGLPPKGIADRFGMAPETISWFEWLFFDVRRFCNKKSGLWLNTVLIPEVHRGGLLPDPMDGFLKLIGFHLGPDVLADLLEMVAPSEENREKVRNYLRSILTMKAHGAVQSLGDPVKILKAYQRMMRDMQRSEKKQKNQPKGIGVERVVEQMMAGYALEQRLKGAGAKPAGPPPPKSAQGQPTGSAGG